MLATTSTFLDDLGNTNNFAPGLFPTLEQLQTSAKIAWCPLRRSGGTPRRP